MGGGGGGGEPGLYCERKWLRNNSRGQDLTLYDAFTLTLEIYTLPEFSRQPYTNIATATNSMNCLLLFFSDNWGIPS